MPAVSILGALIVSLMSDPAVTAKARMATTAMTTQNQTLL